MANKRKRKNTQRGMHKKMLKGKKPMSPERKEEIKKSKEIQRAENSARLAKK